MSTLRVGDILALQRRWLTPEPDQLYVQIGVRSYGKGIFHKEPITGLDLGSKRVLRIEPGDLIFKNVFAWEGAVAIAGARDAGTIGSHRFITLRTTNGTYDTRYLQLYFAHGEGLEAARRASPGSAGRNRTLGIDRFLEQRITLPPFAEQRRVVDQLEQIRERVIAAQALATASGQRLRTLLRLQTEQIFERLLTSHRSVSLRELVTVRGGGTPSKANPLFWDGTIPWVSPKDMKSPEIVDATDHISDVATMVSPAKVIAPGAVLIVVRGMILSHTVPVAVLRVPAAINQDMKALFPCRYVLAEYLAEYIRSCNTHFLALVEKSTHDTRRLDTDKLLAINIPVPPIAVQREILSEIGAIRERTSRALAWRTDASDRLAAVVPATLQRLLSSGT
jgi:restriction endonuclease S subunit